MNMTREAATEYFKEYNFHSQGVSLSQRISYTLIAKTQKNMLLFPFSDLFLLEIKEKQFFKIIGRKKFSDQM